MVTTSAERVQGVYSWHDDGLSDLWSCTLELLSDPVETSDGKDKGTYTARSVFCHMDGAGEEEAGCSYGHWKLEALDGERARVTFTDWWLGAAQPHLMGEGSAYPLDDVEAPLELQILPSAVGSSEGSCDSQSKLELQVQESYS
mmetsp:Transcript_80108/g.139064  ORF Transcript_80108/g.139064 Transcript_80108/m.139064 type:complete len:144 (-) Transcript_80108:309-740(-)